MKHVPNALTITRILITPVLLVLLFTESLAGQAAAFVLFVIAAVSDWLDGKLARSYKVRSRLGQFLDPFADKVLVLGTFIALAILVPHIVPWWAVALVALRDVGVTALRSWAEARGRTIRTLPAARAKTAVQLTFLILLLLFRAGAHVPGAVGAGAAWVLASQIPFIAMIIVVVLTLWTGSLYLTHQEYTPPVEFNG